MRHIFNLILLFVFVCNIAIADEGVEDRRKALLSVIDEEYREISRLSKKVVGKDPTLLLRMAELMLEKARLIKDAELADYLRINPSERGGINKNQYHQKSRSYFSNAQKICAHLLNTYRNFDNKGDVYYVMGYNAKEFNDRKKAITYFQQALKYGARKPELRRRTQLVLAEMYYVDGNYKKAIPMYEQALGGKRDKWWTKDSYNLAWCYFRVNRTQKSISLMKEVLTYSKTPGYIDVSKQVERDMPYIYTESGNVSESIQYFKNKNADVTSNLIKIAQHLKARGKYDKAIATLATAKNSASSPDEKADVVVEELKTYEKKGDYKNHLRACQELADLKKNNGLKKEIDDVLMYHVQSMAAKTQREVTSSQTANKLQRRKVMANLSVAYFALLSDLDLSKSHLHDFHAAETLFAAGEFQRSLEYYQKAESKAKERNDSKIVALAQQGILAAVGNSGVSKQTKDKYLVEIYEDYLKSNPNSKKSYKMYQHLFSAYYDRTDIPNAERTLLTFKKAWPTAHSVQEAMLAKIMDYYKKQNDRENIRSWVARIGNGEFKVSPQYAKKVNLLMMTMQFEGTEKALSKGDKVYALKGYVDIYRDKNSSDEARKNAAYNIAYLFYQLPNLDKMGQWSIRSLEMMDGEDIKKFQNSFLAMATLAHDKRKEQLAHDIHYNVLSKTCSLKAAYNGDLLRNIVIIQLSQNKVDEAINYISKFDNCNIAADTLSDVKLKIVQHVSEGKRYSVIQEVVDKFSNDKSLWGHMIEPLFTLRGELTSSSEKQEMENRIYAYFNHAKSSGEVPVGALNVVAHLKLIRLEQMISGFTSIKLAFPEKTYSALLGQKLNELNNITTKALEILTTGSGKGIVASYKALVESYQQLIDEVKNFIPPNTDNDYLASFKNGMLKVTGPLESKVAEFRREANKHIVQSEILSDYNRFFMKANSPGFNVMYFPDDAVIMDRGGVR